MQGFDRLITVDDSDPARVFSGNLQVTMAYPSKKIERFLLKSSLIYRAVSISLSSPAQAQVGINVDQHRQIWPMAANHRSIQIFNESEIDPSAVALVSHAGVRIAVAQNPRSSLPSWQKFLMEVLLA